MGALNPTPAPTAATSSKPPGRAEAPLDGGNKAEPANDFAQLLRDEGKPAQDKVASRPAEDLAEPAPLTNPALPTAEAFGNKPVRELELDEVWPPAGLAGLIPGLFPAPLVSPTTPQLGLGINANAKLDLTPDAIAAPLPATPAMTLNPAVNSVAVASGTALADSANAKANTGAALPGALVAQASVVTAPVLNAVQVALVPVDPGNLAAALPKEWIDTLRREVETETVSPIGNASAVSSPAGVSLGLARIAVVNPMQAASPDLHGENFDEAIGSRLTWMAEQKIGHAHIRINPQELGPVEIRVRLDGERVHADFSSPQAEVRQALEQSLPKLRDMLAQHGFQLAQADVGQHGDPRSQASGKGDRDADSNGSADGPAQASSITGSQRTSRGLLDAYA